MPARPLATAAVAVALLVSACGDGGQQPDREPFPEGAAAGIEDPRTGVPLGTAVTWSVVDADDELRALIARAFDSVTPENELKPEVVQPSRGEFRFDDADELVAWATEQGLRIRGHTLVWHQQVPGWLGEEDWTPEELEAVLVEHVETVVGRYADRIGTWDVVNEPFTDRGRPRTAPGAPWLDVLGPRYVAVALQAARRADPDGRLFVNEIGAEFGGPKLDALIEMARDLRARGVPLDGIGLEAHLTTRRAPSRERLVRTMERIAAEDLDVEITELDVVNPRGTPRDQAAVYADVAAACAAVERCTRVTIWGVSDRDSWLGADQRPLPFDAQLDPKPAWQALTQGLRR